MKSYIAKPAEVQRKWYVVDAEGKTLGRMASEIAAISCAQKQIFRRSVFSSAAISCGSIVLMENPANG